MPTASITESGPRPSVTSRIAAGEVAVVAVQIEYLDATLARALQPLRNEVDADHLAGAALQGDPA